MVRLYDERNWKKHMSDVGASRLNESPAYDTSDVNT